MEITKELANNQTILLIIPSENYNESITSLMKELSKKNVCYITLNKTFSSMKDLFKKNKINIQNVIFIDAISKSIKETPDQTDSCYYISSPGALTELSLMINKFLRHNFDYIVLDSLTNMMIYEKKAPVAKFLITIINKIKATNTKAVFLSLDTNQDNDLIKQASSFIDKVIKK